MSWVDEIRDAFKRLGGAARYEDLYAFIKKTTERELTKEWKATVRRTIEDHSSDSANYRADDYFRHVGRGFWALRDVEIDSATLDEREELSGEEVVDRILVREHWRKKPSRGPFGNQSFAISHADNSAFETAGLRAFFEYRKMGIADATKDKFDAHVIRAVPGMESPATWHTHDLDFQMVYILKGWVVFEYEGEGEHMLRAGSCVLQPPGIRHREVRHSDDLELLEIISPAEFETHEAEAPE